MELFDHLRICRSVDGKPVLQYLPRDSAMIDGRRKALKTGAGLLTSAALIKSAPLLAQTNDRFGIRGYVAPEIELDYWIDHEGEPTQFSVAESKGKWLFLKFFQNWCPGCHSSGFPTLKAFSDAFHDNPKVAIAGVQTVFEGYNVNTQDAVRELQLRYEIQATMGHDPGDAEAHTPGDTMRNYRTGGTPWLVLVDPNGAVAFNDYHVDTNKLIDFVAEQVA